MVMIEFGTKMRRLHSLYLVFVLCLLNGCFSGNLTQETYPVQSNSTQDNEHLLIRDFGVVRPHSEQSHIFTLKNSTDSDWKISRIVENYSCTVVKTSADAVSAGGSLDIELTYRAGTDFTDDRRDTIVEFEQEDVLPITLRVEAKIRPQIVLSPT